MFRKLMMIGMLAVFLSTTTYAFSEDVFVTQRGSKYHKAECLSVKDRDVTKMEKKEAIKEGYGPCKRCFEEDVVVNQEKKDQEQVKK